jgi:hypothetical protein
MKAIVLSVLRFLSVLITGLWVVFVVGVAAQEKKAQDKKVNKEAREAVLRMADLVGQKDMVLLKQQAEAVAKSIESLDEVMNLLRARTKGGLGVGDTPGAILPDGMEAKLVNISRRPLGQPQLAKESKALVRLAQVNAAIAQISEARTSVDGMKDAKSWQKWSADMRQSAIELAEAAEAMDAARVKVAAKKLNTSCTECHDKFR